ncbi:MAG: DUF1059 domain-containing protein [Pseudonocardia sp.]|nr:DUF1059 domain-containing protein [Pseudonocardia sp.]
MSRMMIDCRTLPSESDCSLTLMGEPEEVMRAAAAHAVDVHGHTDDEELRAGLRGALVAAPVDLPEGAFVQLIDFRTDRIAEFDAIEDEWLAAIGGARTARWSVVSEDRDEPGRYCELVAFPDAEAAERNSKHPATQEIAARLSEMAGTPEFRNLEIRRVRAYPVAAG